MRRGALALSLLLSVSSLQPIGTARAVTVDGVFDGSGRVAAGSVTELQVAGRGGVPQDATFAMANITVTGPLAPGYVSAYPCDAARPNASTVNFAAGETVPNAAVVALSATGSVCLYSSAAAHLIVDVSGYFAAGTSVVGVGPLRLMDSRSGSVSATYDGRFRGIGPLRGGSTTALQVVGRADVQEATRVALLNVTATEASAPAYVTAWPCDRNRPLVSNLNVVPGRTVANLAVVNVSKADGTVCLFTSADMQLVVDIVGYVDPPDGLRAPPVRLMDSRVGAVSKTIDGQFEDLGVLPAGTTTELVATGRSLLPGAGVAAVVMNVTVTEPAAPGYVAVHPCDEPAPLASNVNFVAGQTTSNTVVAEVDPDRPRAAVCISNSAATHLVVDAMSWIEARDRQLPWQWGFQGLTPARLLDTRPVRPTWVERPLGEPAFASPGDIECPTPLRCVVASGDRAEQPYLLVTNDAGLTWSGIATGANEDSFGEIACPTPDDCYVGRAHYSEGLSVAFTHDGGVTWGSTDVSENADIAALGPLAFRAFACAGPRHCIGSLDGSPNATIETVDGGASWRLVDASPEYALQSISCPSATSCVGAALRGTDPVFVRSTSGGLAWTSVRDLPAGDRWEVDCPSPKTCAVATWTWAPGGGDGLLLTTFDAGATWSEHTLPTQTIHDLSCVSALACFVTEGSGPGVYRTLDSGATWTLRTTVTGRALSISCASLERCMAGTRSAVVVGSPP